MTQVIGRDARAAPHVPLPLDEDTAPARKPRTRPLVLLVDDIEDCRDVYGQFLRHTGYEVVEASDGSEALVMATTLAPDAIVMDLWMPHLDGWESIRRLKALPATASIPVLVLTGDAYAQARSEAEDAGCQAYLVKPCLPMDVAAEVGRLLVDVRAGTAPSDVRVLSERRAGGRRHSETAGGLLATVVADVDRRYREVSHQLSEMEKELYGLEGEKRTALLDRLEKVRATEKALARNIDALKLISRSADVKITIPARRRSRKS
ncbi:MAG TPA: response regulator [Vicinamibacteria bacterium]|jgi:CheY-like chemotaxis protein|nr:response regulator [Vicinamibacteria bacterium]